MAGKLVTGLAAGAGSFIGLVLGAGIAQFVLAKKAETWETKNATLVLGSIAGMVGGAALGASIAAEPEQANAAGTAGIPAGVGAAKARRAPVRGGAINSQLMPGG